jgi:hypothetical protein
MLISHFPSALIVFFMTISNKFVSSVPSSNSVAFFLLQSMEVDGHNERVAILDAGAQYGKVNYALL